MLCSRDERLPLVVMMNGDDANVFLTELHMDKTDKKALLTLRCQKDMM